MQLATQPMSESSVQPSENGENKAATLSAAFESLEIPPGIDPKLLQIWLEREREEVEKNNEVPRKENVRRGRQLSILFAAYIGITVMCLTIALGFLQEKEPAEILAQTCRMFLCYCAAGFVVGKVTERCINESAETLLREIVRRCKET